MGEQHNVNVSDEMDLKKVFLRKFLRYANFKYFLELIIKNQN